MMKWVRVLWVAVTYIIAISILISLFDRFSQPFQTAVIALIGLVFVAVKEESVLLGAALTGEFMTLGRSLVGMTDLITSTASEEAKERIGYDHQLFLNSLARIDERKRMMDLSPSKITVAVGLMAMLLVCLYNLLWALNN